MQTIENSSSKGAVRNVDQAMEVIRRAYLAHPLTMRELRHFFLSRRGARCGFKNPPTLTAEVMKDLMDLGVIRLSKPSGSERHEIAPWPIILEALDRVDANGNPIAKHVSTPPIPPPPSSRKNGQSGPPSSRRSGRPSNRWDREPVTQADFLALAHEDDDDEVTQQMDRTQMEATAAGMNEVQELTVQV